MARGKKITEDPVAMEKINTVKNNVSIASLPPRLHCSSLSCIFSPHPAVLLRFFFIHATDSKYTFRVGRSSCRSTSTWPMQ